MRLLVICLLSIVSLPAFSATYTATGAGGEWTNPATWVGGVVPPTAGTGDVIDIPIGSVVTITNQTVSFNGTLNIAGTLSLLATVNFAWAELDMDAASVVNILATGQVTSGGGGNFEFFNGIVIGTNIFAYWPGVGAGSNPQTGPATITEGNGVLPVEIIFFQAISAKHSVELTWATASEENFDYFSIERSTDGENFIEIARVNGAGESKERIDYNYTDEFPIEGRSYYRLRSIDFDGYTEIFDYKMVEVIGVSPDFNIYPNPIEDGKFSLQTNFDTGDNAQLMVYNSMGGIEMNLKVNNWLTNHSLQGLRPGTYLFRLVSAEGIMVKRIIVR